MMRRRRSHSRLKGEINVVPYIDVMLVLLVIFMVTAPLINQGVEVDLPKATAEPIELPEDDLEVVVLSVQKDGTCHLNIGGEAAQLIQCDTLEPQRRRVSALLLRQPQPPVLVRADRETRYERVLQAMTALKSVGAAKLGLPTAPLDGSPSG